MPPKTKRGKENAAPKKEKEVKEVSVSHDDFDAMIDIDEEPPVKKKAGRQLQTKKKVEAERESPKEVVPDVEKSISPAPAPAFKGEKGDSVLRKRLEAMTAERDRAIKERETYIKQFEELSRLRQSTQESLLERFKEQTAVIAKAQEDVIANQTTLNDKLVAKVSELEKALAAQRAATDKAEGKAAAAEAPPALEGKLEGKSAKELHNEVFKLRNSLKSREDELSRIQREYEQEVAQSRKLQKEARPSVPVAPVASASAPASSEESQKDHASLSLYEDLTGLTMLNVRIRKGASGKEVLYSCMQTTDGRSFAFKLRAYNEFDRSTNKWAQQLEFTPDGLQNEKDKKFVDRLGPFASGFVLPRDQAQAAWEQLRARVSKDGVFKDPLEA